MEFLLGLFVGYTLAWPMLALLFVIGLVLEHNEARWSAFFCLIAMVWVVAAQVAMPSAGVLAIVLLVYAVVGIVWSFWRYKLFVDQSIEEASPKASEVEMSYLISRVSPEQNVSRIVSWVLTWPLGVIEYSFRGAFSAVEYAVKHVFQAVYKAIYNRAVRKLNTR